MKSLLGMVVVEGGGDSKSYRAVAAESRDALVELVCYGRMSSEHFLTISGEYRHVGSAKRKMEQVAGRLLIPIRWLNSGEWHNFLPRIRRQGATV